MSTKLSLYVIVIFLCLFVGQNILSQTSRDNYAGFWENPDSWKPRWNNPETNEIDRNITIKGYIKTVDNLSFDEGNLTVFDTLVIAGNLVLEDAKITLTKNAILIVLGSVIINDDDGEIKVEEGGYIVVGGEFLVQDDGDLNFFSSNDDQPNIYIADKIQPSAITDDDSHFASLDCKNPENPYPHSDCTYGDFVDFESDPLYTFYETLIHGDPPSITFQPLDVTVCNESNIEFTVVADNVETYQWQVNDGDGFVNLVDNLSHAGSSSNQLRIQNITTIQDGYVYRCNVSNEKDISILSAPALLTVATQVTADAGTDASICQNSSYKVSGASVAHGNGDYLWTHDGKGTLTDDQTLTPTYTPNALDAGKTVELMLSAEGNSDCSAATDKMTITVEAQVTAHAGTDASICQNSSHTVSGASVVHGNGSVSWSHDGNGTLTDDQTLTPTYTPNAMDADRTVILTLTATGNADCANDMDQVSIKIDKQIIGSTGIDDAICGTTYVLNGSGNGGTGIWLQSNGPGEATFLPRNDMEAPKVVVTESGEYVFKWIVSNGQCSDESLINIHFKEVPNVTIEAEAQVCGLEQFISASPNKGTGFWQIVSGPEGSFLEENSEKNNNNIQVKEIGTYVLSWIANLNGCMDTAYQEISFNQVPKAYAGSDKELFYNRESVMDASLQNNETGYWKMETGFGLIENKNLPTTKVTHLQLGDNIFEWVVNNGLCESKSTVTVKVSDAQIPNVITPNGDAMNDYFIIKDIENLGPIHLVIFNRWGNKIYESREYKNKWDGRDISGNELMNDTYYYYLEFAKKNVIKGYVLIQR